MRLEKILASLLLATTLTACSSIPFITKNKTCITVTKQYRYEFKAVCEVSGLENYRRVTLLERISNDHQLSLQLHDCSPVQERWYCKPQHTPSEQMSYRFINYRND